VLDSNITNSVHVNLECVAELPIYMYNAFWYVDASKHILLHKFDSMQKKK